LLIVGGVALFAALFTQGSNDVRKFFRTRRHQRGRWTRAEESDDESVNVYVVEPGTERHLLVGAAPFAREDFELLLEELRVEAQQRLVALNSNRKELRR